MNSEEFYRIKKILDDKKFPNLFLFSRSVTQFLKAKDEIDLCKNIKDEFVSYIYNNFKSKNTNINCLKHFYQNNILTIDIPYSINRNKRVNPSYFGILCEACFILFIHNKEINFENIINLIKDSNSFNYIENKNKFISYISFFIRNKENLMVIEQLASFFKQKYTNFTDNIKTNEYDLQIYKIIDALTCEFNNTDNKIDKEYYYNTINKIINNWSISDSLYNSLKPFFYNTNQTDRKSFCYYGKYQTVISQFEIDLLADDTIIEIKTSSSEFSDIWFYQVLLYYFCLKKMNYKIENISILNLYRKEFFKVKVSEIIDEELCFKFLVENKII